MYHIKNQLSRAILIFLQKSAGAVQSAAWNCAVVRTDTDINGQVRTINLLERCDKPYHHKPRRQRAAPRCRALPLVGLDRKSISRAAAQLNKLPLACRASARQQAQHNRRQAQSQRASIRSVIAPLFASFAEEARQERTDVRDWSADDRKARESKRERSVNKKKWCVRTGSNRGPSD